MIGRWTSAASFVRCAVSALAVVASGAAAQPDRSVAREWNEALLQAIREDLARPPVHARNLFHTAVAMYDAWAAYDDVAAPYLLGRSRDGLTCDTSGLVVPTDREAARREAVSYAAYRVLTRRFQNSPGALDTLPRFDSLLVALGYDPAVTTTDPATPAGLGNRVAACVLAYGLADGANEAVGYETTHYAAVNPPLDVAAPGNPTLVDFNRWQPLRFETFVDQSGHEIPGGTPPFVGPEWGGVRPFALSPAARTVRHRADGEYVLYGDPGPPPQWSADGSGSTDDYLWGHALVALWSGHLDPADGVLWDISPASLGHLAAFPEGAEAVRQFYADAGQGVNGDGWDVNPVTGQPYAPQVVPRGDYTRVLAEFWADGPRSETPPGHWFVILNGVSDDPRLVKQWGGSGPILDDLEWDVKTYLALGGAVHDAAVTAWGLKGWYDSIRPVSAIRAVAGLGQSSEPEATDYDPAGFALAVGAIERIAPGDPLAGDADEHVGELKLWAWRGPEALEDSTTDVAGVGWIRAAEWWPYQQPTFVTPPFAGYVSGHSTYSRAAVEVLTAATGTPFFPGGLGEFAAPKDVFLRAERGPSVDVVLQWATYRDAADQCSLSRIWGGIHPPFDDLPGRRIGEEIGQDAAALAVRYFEGDVPVAVEATPEAEPSFALFPSPVRAGQPVTVRAEGQVRVIDVRGRVVVTSTGTIPTDGLAPGLYVVRAEVGGRSVGRTLLVVR